MILKFKKKKKKTRQYCKSTLRENYLKFELTRCPN